MLQDEVWPGPVPFSLMVLKRLDEKGRIGINKVSVPV